MTYLRKQLLCLAFFLLTCLSAHSQGWEKTATGIRTTLGSTDLELRFYDASTVRVLKSPTGKPFVKKSFSVVAEPVETAFSAKQEGTFLRVKTKQLQVLLDLETGKIAFAGPKGESLIAESEAATFTDFNDIGTMTYSVGQRFKLDADEAIYGLGQRMDGKLSRRNISMRMVQGNTDDYIPFFVSTKGYGLFWDNTSPTQFTDNAEGTHFLSEVGDGIDYYVMNGGNMDGAVAGMRKLTGEVPLFPLWTYGFLQSKERYKSQDELLGVVKKYRELEVPLDGIIQDWQYWGSNYLWNSMDFLNSEFGNPRKMVNDIHGMNAHLMISIWSSFGPQTLQFREMEPKGMLLDFKTWPESGVDFWPPNMNYPSGVKPYDPFNPEARDIYWKYLNKGLFSLGIDGWWMDSTEPDHHSFKPTDFDLKTHLGSLRKVRNAYPIATVGGVYDHQRAQSSDKRVFILTRSAFAGQQRYGANTWSGDVNSSWQSLRNQIPAGLNFSLTGIPYWNSDIGGFFAGSYNRKWNDGSGTKNPLYQELYVRWMQFGAFTPMMRSHGTEVPREIYHFGKKGEPVYDAIEKAIHLRYSFLPYLYSTAWAVTSKNYTFMRALAMDFGKDPKVKDMDNEYLFGPSILVAPVIKAQYTPETVVKTNETTGWDRQAGADGKNLAVDFTQKKSHKVYLPAGATWYDFWTNQPLGGGREIETETSLDRIPLYVRAGSILPMGPSVQYATEKRWDNLEIRVYEGANGSFQLYEDENDSYRYENNVYSTISFDWNEAAKTLIIGARKGSFPGMLTERVFNVVRMTRDGVTAAKEIWYSGKKVVVRW